MSKNNTNWLIAAGLTAAAFFALDAIGKKSRAKSEKHIDGGNPYLAAPEKDSAERGAKKPSGVKHTSKTAQDKNAYIRSVKPVVDKTLSFAGLLFLAPVYAGISLAIVIDDPGPVLFKQKRVGKDKHFFELHKFRSMKMSTPHDVPTHQLSNPDHYITRVGRFLRKTSLDELPQVWDIFVGNMSIIGPRPALWNQEDLVAERDRYDANSLTPGLTGWAQINGRDELEIPVKAGLDGEYARIVRKSSLDALKMDIKCFFGTIKSVAKEDGVVEGGTGTLHAASKNSVPLGLRDDEEITPESAGFKDYANLKHFDIDLSAANQKKVLITGAGSYIGEAFKNYAKTHYPKNFSIDTVDTMASGWPDSLDWTSYDTAYHVAGIAHADVGHVDQATIDKYYAVNTDLAIDMAKRCRDAGVKQFVFMSSAIIYGDSAPFGTRKIITSDTLPNPGNYYGDSKWQADKGVRKFASESFHVAVLRPPMIYGRGSKGNYPTLSKLAKRLPVFPDIDNQRSMLYIGNLCEFLCRLILSGEGGIFFPQNTEYTKTSDMVKEISAVSHSHIIKTGILNPAVAVAGKIPGKVGGLVDKAFGNLTYDQKLSRYDGLDYNVSSLKKSIALTEGKQTDKRCVLILVNHDVVIYNFRLELVQRLLSEGYEVHISCPFGEHTEELRSLGAVMHDIDIDRHGMNLLQEAGILRSYEKLIKSVCPDIVLTYTIKPNIYGGIASRRAHIPFVANVTGLGTSVNDGGIKEQLILKLYKEGLRGAWRVFFQNAENRRFMTEHHIVTSGHDLLPGSGVNLVRHCYEQYPSDTEWLIFTTIGRIMKDKGTDELLEAARIIKNNYPHVTFRLVGFYDGDYEKKVRKAVEAGIIEYIPQQSDVHPIIKDSHAIIHPSYHEGMSNVLLEAAATGRPVIASNIPGCREAFDEGKSGFGFKVKSSHDLAKAIETFILLPYEQKASMGKAGRKKMEAEFNRDIVVDKYMKEIKKVCGDRFGKAE